MAVESNPNSSVPLILRTLIYKFNALLSIVLMISKNKKLKIAQPLRKLGAEKNW